MHLNQVVTALKREKALLEEVLLLAECQLELIQSGRLADFEILLTLRSEPMSELAMAEVHVGAEMPELENDRALTPKEVEEMRHLNLQIISLADQIIAVDERAELLAEQRNFCLLPENPAQAGL